MWDVETKQQLAILPHSDWVQSMVFANSGQTLISSSRDRHIKYWDVSTQQVQTTILSYSNGLWAIAISPDRKQ